MLKKIFSGKSLLILIFLLFVAELVYQSSGLLRTEDDMAAGDYVHLLGTIIGSLMALSLPLLLARRLRLVIPGPTLAIFALMVFAPMYLGTLRDWYEIFPPFDTILHFTGCASIVLFGFAIAAPMQRPRPSPVLLALFAFGLSMSLGVVWELLEFGLDTLFGTNTQRFATIDGVPFEGQAALVNTMVDLLANMVGAGAMAAAGYFSLKKENGWMRRFYVVRVCRQ